MRKIIKIGEKDYTLKSSAYTQFAYKNMTGRSMFDDVQRIEELGQETNLSIIEELTDLLTHMAYVMIEEADSTQVDSYDEFVKTLDALFDNAEWIEEVVKLAISPISRQLQADVNIKQVEQES